MFFPYSINTFLNRPTVLCKILGVYQIGYHNRVTGKRSMEQVAVMQVSLVLWSRCCIEKLNHGNLVHHKTYLRRCLPSAEYILQQENHEDL